MAAGDLFSEDPIRSFLIGITRALAGRRLTSANALNAEFTSRLGIPGKFTIPRNVRIRRFLKRRWAGKLGNAPGKNTMIHIAKNASLKSGNGELRTRTTASSWQREYNEKNREIKNQKAALARKRNPGHFRLLLKRYRDRHPERYARLQKKWRDLNREAFRAAQRKWAANNKGKISARMAKRRAVIAGCSVSEAREIELWMIRIRKLKCVKCYWCGARCPGDRTEFDHIVALDKGGSTFAF